MGYPNRCIVSIFVHFSWLSKPLYSFDFIPFSGLSKPLYSFKHCVNWPLSDLGHVLPHHDIQLKQRLHYNELAQRTATVWRYLTFGDIRCYTLKKSDECVR